MALGSESDSAELAAAAGGGGAAGLAGWLAAEQKRVEGFEREKRGANSEAESVVENEDEEEKEENDEEDDEDEGATTR